MRIVTRADFDGIVCAALLYDAEKITEPVLWAEPGDMQHGIVDVRQGDIIANLPYHRNCSLWFDHHYTNRLEKSVSGLYEIAPSAAGLIYRYYHGRFSRDYQKLVEQTDRIDSADLTRDEVRCPEKYSYVMLSMTVSGRNSSDQAYWNQLIGLLRRYDIAEVMRDEEVKARCRRVVQENADYKRTLLDHTRMEHHVSISDFRPLNPAPSGNRFLVYSLFPDSFVNVKIRYDSQNPDKIIVSAGHSIFNRKCNVNIGLLLARFGGGGHRGAGSCRFDRNNAAAYIPSIIDALAENRNNEE